MALIVNTTHYFVPDIVVSTYTCLISQPYKVGTTIIPMLQVRQLRHRKVYELPKVTQVASDSQYSAGWVQSPGLHHHALLDCFSEYQIRIVHFFLETLKRYILSPKDTLFLVNMCALQDIDYRRSVSEISNELSFSSST